MPTQNPRVNVTLTPSLDLLLARMARHTRTSKSQVLRELLQAAEPALQRTAALMDAASKAATAVKGDLARDLEKAQAEAESYAEQALSSLDEITDDLVAQAETVRERRPARRLAPALAASDQAAAARPDPLPSKRGVNSARKGGRR